LFLLTAWHYFGAGPQKEAPLIEYPLNPSTRLALLQRHGDVGAFFGRDEAIEISGILVEYFQNISKILTTYA
jgi:hypothetical protein